MDDLTPKAQVISIKTRCEMPTDDVEPFSDPTPPEPGFDEDTVGMADEFAAACRAGRHRGGLVVGWNSQDRCFFSDLVLPIDDHADNSAAKLIGYLETIKAGLIEIMQAEHVVELS